MQTTQQIAQQLQQVHPNANDFIGKMVPVVENGVQVIKTVVGA